MLHIRYIMTASRGQPCRPTHYCGEHNNNIHDCCSLSLSLTAHPTLHEDPRDFPPRDSAPKRTLHTRLSSSARHAPCQIVATARDKPSLARPETAAEEPTVPTAPTVEGAKSIFLGCPPRHLEFATSLAPPTHQGNRSMPASVPLLRRIRLIIHVILLVVAQ